jgi:hypothetical protein
VDFLHLLRTGLPLESAFYSGIAKGTTFLYFRTTIRGVFPWNYTGGEAFIFKSVRGEVNATPKAGK